MAARVGTLRCRYRVRGSVAIPWATGRLERMARVQLPDELAAALSGLDTDGAVYVVRQVHARTTIDLTGADGALARSWSHDLARSVATAISTHAGDGTEVVRFDSQAQFVTAFVADLLAGTAWRRWYFGAFRQHRGRSVGEAVEAVLREHRADLPAILAELSRRGVLEDVLTTVDVAALGLRDAPEHSDPAREAEGWRPLVAAAHHLVSALGSWTGTTPDVATVLHLWVADAPGQPDWRDAASLTDAVAAAVRWLVTSGLARHPASATPGHLAAAVAGLDWLDLPRLTAALTRAQPRGDHPDLPIRGRAEATPRQRAALRALVRAIREHRPALDTAVPASPANAARLLAALARTDPRWAEDPLVPVLVEQVLATFGAALVGGPGQGAVSAVAEVHPAHAVAAWQRAARTGTRRSPDQARSGTERPVAAAAALGEPADEVLAALLDTVGPGDRSTSPVAGVLLLQRVLTDVRLAGLAARHHHPPPGPAHLVAAVGLWWAGDAGATDGVLDPAVQLLAGDGAPRTVRELADAWRQVGAAEHESWRVVVDDLLARHRLAPSESGGDPLAYTAGSLLRIWARWLRGFEHSSVPYLLERLIRRPGTVVVAPDAVTVHLPRRPLDTVLEVSGYLRPIEAFPGLSSRRFEFRVGEGG